MCRKNTTQVVCNTTIQSIIQVHEWIGSVVCCWGFLISSYTSPSFISLKLFFLHLNTLFFCLFVFSWSSFCNFYLCMCWCFPMLAYVGTSLNGSNSSFVAWCLFVCLCVCVFLYDHFWTYTTFNTTTTTNPIWSLLLFFVFCIILNLLGYYIGLLNWGHKVTQVLLRNGLFVNHSFGMKFNSPNKKNPKNFLFLL